MKITVPQVAVAFVSAYITMLAIDYMRQGNNAAMRECAKQYTYDTCVHILR